MSVFYFLFQKFHIFIIYVYFVSFVVSAVPEDCYNGKIRTAGTGTVLFNPTDVYKTCWSEEEIAILTARLILEDVIPDPKVISIQCNEEIDELVEYFKAVIDTIRSNTKARKRHIMLVAFTDLLGGYLHHVILPKARYAYYAGAVDYAYMEKLIQLYEELKWFLRTNGQGWTKPMVNSKEITIPPIQLNKNDNINKPNDSCCHKLMFYEHEPLKARKRAISTEKGIYFPLPFFDAKYRPTAIVVPLKRFALRNIESKRAAYVIMKYFISAEKCLKEKNAKPDITQKFQNNLYTWIKKEVIPKLNDDKFYSAFGGVLRVQSTLKALGARIGPVSCNTDDGEEEVGAVPTVGCSSKRNKTFLIAMLIVIVAWFLVGTCFICYRMKNSRSAKTGKLDETTKPESSTSFSSSRWSSLLSRSSSRTSRSHKQLCKCCESTISEKSTTGYTSTSEYDSEKTRKKDKRKKVVGPANKKVSQSSPCVCPNNGPAVIDTNHSMKVLPSIAEMSENSLPKAQNGSLKKISFADESGISSSDGGSRPCAPPWAQTKNTIPCPVLSDKSTNYSTSRSITTKSRTVNDSTITDIPIANSSKYETSMQQTSSNRQTNISRGDPSSTSYETPSNRTNVNASRSNPSGTNYDKHEMSRYHTETFSKRNEFAPTSDNATFNKRDDFEPPLANSTFNKRDDFEPPLANSTFNKRDDFEPPLANSTFRNDATETTNDNGTSNTAGEESYQNDSNKSINKHASTASVEASSYDSEKKRQPNIKKEPGDKQYYDYHMSACHSSISGNYDLFQKTDPSKPYIFGYDFQTSTSSDLSDDDDSKY